MHGAGDREGRPTAKKPREEAASGELREAGSGPGGQGAAPDRAPSGPTDPSSVTLEDEGLAADGASFEPVPSSVRPPEVADILSPSRYEILGEFARGGLGRILKARDRRLDRIVALKELRRDHPVARTRFIREVQVTARLQHPNIIPLHEAGSWPTGESVYSMKLVDGKTLAQAIGDAAGPNQRFALLPALIDVAEAIAYAHSQHIIHRDLKPANVLVGPFGETVVIDWGLAKYLNDDDPVDPLELLDESSSEFETRVGAIIGTPAYMPPEQAAGAPVDERADVYALGAMLYHVISGQSPYAEYEQEHVLQQVANTAPTPLGTLATDAPPDLVAIVEKAMARDPNDRYPSAGEMAEELRRFANGRLVDAYRYTLLDYLGRFLRRYRAVVVTIALAALALAVFGALSIARITEERDRAENSAEAEKVARGVAERRVDELLVEKARALVDRDPTRAVAWLKRLVTIPTGAASVAALAQDRGVALRVLRGHADLVSAVAVSKTGNWVATGDADKRVRLWNLKTREARWLTGHTERITAVEFSPDDRLVVSTSYDGTARLWNVDEGDMRVLRGHRGPIKSVGFSPDGRRLLTVSADGTARLWNLSTLESVSWEAPSDRSLFGEFSADGKWILTGSHHGTVQVTELETQQRHELSAHEGPVNAAVVSAHGEWAVTGGEDGTARLWNLATQSEKTIHRGAAITALALAPDDATVAIGDRAGRVLTVDLPSGKPLVVVEHGERIGALAFSPDGRYLASGAWDKTAGLFDRAMRSATMLKGHTDIVSSIAFSGDGHLLATASWDKTARLWHLPERDEPRSYRGHSIGVRSVAFSPNGRRLVSAGHDNLVRLWNVDTFEGRVFSGHTDHVYRVEFSPDGRLIASSSDDQTVRLWNVDTGESRVLTRHEADVEELSFSPDGTRLATASEDDTAHLVTIDTGEVHVLHHRNDVTALAFSPDGEKLASASRDHSVVVWDGRTGEKLDALLAHSDEVWGVSYAPDGSSIASSSVDGTAILWNPKSGKTSRFENLPGARVIQFSPDGSTLSVAGVAPRLWICRVVNLKCEDLQGHRAIVRDVGFSASKDVLVSAGGDGTVQIWDLVTKERRVLEGHAAPIFDLDLSPDGRFVATASGDAVVRVLPVEPPPNPKRLRSFLDGLTSEVIRGELERGVEN